MEERLTVKRDELQDEAAVLVANILESDAKPEKGSGPLAISTSLHSESINNF